MDNVELIIDDTAPSSHIASWLYPPYCVGDIASFENTSDGNAEGEGERGEEAGEKECDLHNCGLWS